MHQTPAKLLHEVVTSPPLIYKEFGVNTLSTNSLHLVSASGCPGGKYDSEAMLHDHLDRMANANRV